MEAGEAAQELVRFDAEIPQTLGLGNRGAGPREDHELAPLSAVLLRTESASSSQIEQITAGARSLALVSLGMAGGPNAALVGANVQAMDRALSLADDLTVEGIVAVQEALLHESAPHHAGRFREGPVWIGGRGSSPHTATFVPPRYERLPDLMTDLVAFIERTDVDPFIQVAVAHAQFETIHPFSDGNGRTGRALVHAMLRHYGITRRLTVPVSAGLLVRVEAYYAALGAFREGDLEPIVAEFSAAAFTAAATGRVLVADLGHLMQDWRERITARSHATVWRALPVIVSQPAVSAAFLAARLDVSVQAATHAIGQLVDAGILTPVGNRRRHRVWTADEVLRALDEFSRRAGRRELGR